MVNATTYVSAAFALVLFLVGFVWDIPSYHGVFLRFLEASRVTGEQELTNCLWDSFAIVFGI